MKRIPLVAFRIRALTNYLHDLISLQASFYHESDSAVAVIEALRQLGFQLCNSDKLPDTLILLTPRLLSDAIVRGRFLVSNVNASSDISTEQMIIFRSSLQSLSVDEYLGCDPVDLPIEADDELLNLARQAPENGLTVISKSIISSRKTSLFISKLKDFKRILDFKYLILGDISQPPSILIQNLQNSMAELCLQMSSHVSSLVYEDKLIIDSMGIGYNFDLSVMMGVSFSFQFLLDATLSTPILQRAYETHTGRSIYWMIFLTTNYIEGKDQEWDAFYLVKVLEFLNSILLVSVFQPNPDWKGDIEVLEKRLYRMNSMKPPPTLENAHRFIMDQGLALLDKFGLGQYRIRKKSIENRFPDQTLVEANYFFIINTVNAGESLIYRCLHQLTRKLAVIKRIPKLDLGKSRKLETELDFLRGFDHINIVKYLDSFETENHLFLVMEYCDSELMPDEDFCWPEIEARQICRQILQGLAYLHSNHVVHRDIKPSNILLQGSGFVKIADFGEAHIYNRSDDDRKFDLTDIRGTPRYMAPECLHKWMVSPSADIWSFGCLLGRMLFGVDPWVQCPNKLNVFFTLVSGDCEPPFDWDSFKVSKDAKTIFAAIFQRDPEKRPKAVELLRNPYFSLILD